MRFINWFSNNTKNKSNLGYHKLVDYSNFRIKDETEFANFIFQTMKYLIKNYTTMKIIHSHLHIFNPLYDKPGFTCVLLLDASHFTAHSYSEEGILAVDLFTCGNNDTTLIINELNKIILEKYPNCIVKELYSLERFNLNKKKPLKYEYLRWLI